VRVLSRCGQQENIRFAPESLRAVSVTPAVIVIDCLQALVDLLLDNLINFRCAQAAPTGLPGTQTGNCAGNSRAAGASPRRRGADGFRVADRAQDRPQRRHRDLVPPAQRVTQRSAQTYLGIGARVTS
jgi:hypothetical protein